MLQQECKREARLVDDASGSAGGERCRGRAGARSRGLLTQDSDGKISILKPRREAAPA
jgi:hypothetical protein